MTGTASYVSVDDLREHVTIEDARDDSRLLNAGLSASRLIDQYCGRQFDGDTVATPRRFISPAGYPSDWTRRFHVDDFWSTTGLIVQTDDNGDGVYDTTWTQTTDFYLDPVNGVRNGIIGWPYSEIVATTSRAWPFSYLSTSYRFPIQITAKWGWASVPQTVKQAALTLALRLFAEKDAPFGISSVGLYVGRDRMMQVADLLSPFRDFSTVCGVA